MSADSKKRGSANRIAPVLILALITGAAACASTRGPPQPITSPTGYTYPLGTPPTETLYSQTATLYIRQGDVERALELAQEGIEEGPENPAHYFVAGRALSRLGRYEEATRMFERAQEIYPAYELDIEPERLGAWAEEFNRGVEAYGEGDFETAIEAWRAATVTSDLRPGAHQNLATLLAGRGEYEEAIQVYQEALEGLEKRPATRLLSEEEIQDRAGTARSIEASLTQLLMFEERYAEAEPLLRDQLENQPGDTQLRSDLATALNGIGRTEEAGEIYNELLSAEGLQAGQLFNLGVALFRTDDYDEAAEAFRRLTELQPASRDAWFNYANALFAAESWGTLTQVVPRVQELDPLNESAALILARALYEEGEEDAARAAVGAADSMSVYVDRLQFRPGATETVVQGDLVGNVAEPGTPIRLRFHFESREAPPGSELITVPAPASNERVSFEAVTEGTASAYRYEVER